MEQDLKKKIYKIITSVRLANLYLHAWQESWVLYVLSMKDYRYSNTRISGKITYLIHLWKAYIDPISNMMLCGLGLEYT